MSNSALQLDRLRDQLVSGIPGFERRRRRRRELFAAVGVIVVAGTVAGLLAFGGDGHDQVATGDQPGGEANSVRPPVVLFSAQPDGRIAVSDLSTGASVEYSAGDHTILESGDLDSAILAGDRLIAWQVFRPTFVYPAGRDADGRLELLDGVLEQPGRPIGTITGEREIEPTDDSDSAWILGVVDPTAGVDPPLELVDLQTGEVLLSTTVPARQARVLGTIGDDIVIHPQVFEPGTDLLVVSPSGETTTLGVPPGTESASLIAATPTHTVWLDGGGTSVFTGDRMLVVGRDGDTTEIPVPGDEAGAWSMTGWPTVVSCCATLPTVTTNGQRLLLTLTDPEDPNHGPNRMAVVNLEQGTIESVYETGELNTAFWAGDDRTAVVINSAGDDRQTVTTIDTATGAIATIDDAVPPGFAVIAAR